MTGPVAELFENGKGKWTVLTMLMMTLAGGTSWWFTNEAQHEIIGLRAYCDERVQSGSERMQREFDLRRQDVNERMGRIENRVDQFGDRLNNFGRFIYQGTQQ